MLQFDLSNTALLDSHSALPSEAEILIVPVAIMLATEVPYSALETAEIEFDRDMVERVATCIERQLSVFTQDLGRGERLRRRLEEFVGMRVTCPSIATDYGHKS